MVSTIFFLTSTAWSCIGSVLPAARGSSKYRRFFSCLSHSVASAARDPHCALPAGRSVRVPMRVGPPFGMGQAERYTALPSNKGLTRK